MSSFTASAFDGTGFGGGQLGSARASSANCCATTISFSFDRALRGGQFAACFAELDGGEARGIDAFRVGNRLLGGLQIGGREPGARGRRPRRTGGGRHAMRRRRRTMLAFLRGEFMDVLY